MESLWIPPDQNLYRTLARHICASHAEQLPDLSSIRIILPQLHAAPELRRELLSAAATRGHTAILGAHISTLKQFVASNSLSTAPTLEGPARELLLAEALARFPHLYGKSSPWMLAESLLQLFDELTLNLQSLPDDIAALYELLAKGYGIRGNAPAALGREATLVHTLWHAWHAQLRELGRVDCNAAYVLQLATAAHAAPDTHVYVLSAADMTAAEHAWLETLIARGQATRVQRGYPPASTATPPRAALLDATFIADTPPLRERAQQFARDFPVSPLTECTTLFTADSDEDEALAVDLQVRQWLLDGIARIGIVTESRRLARRVRALLERAGVLLNDTGGWALSTTSAATALERWLQTVEEDFAHEPLLDVLKSPFVFTDTERAAHLRCVWRFQEDVVQNGNVARGMDRYVRQARVHRLRLPVELAAHSAPIEALLNRVNHSAQPLLRVHDARAHTPQEFLDALHASVERLGLTAAWPGDAAGIRVLDELERLHAAATHTTIRMAWTEFRAWLGRALEQAMFVPPASGHPVRLCSLAQTDAQEFDAVVVAGCEQQYFAAAGNASPFFNDGVRKALHLPTAEQRLNTQRSRLLNLLGSARHMTLTRTGLRDGETVLPAPWWEALRVFHQVAWGNTLRRAEFETRVRDPRAQVQTPDQRALPATATRAQVRIDPTLLPTELSADAYQRLIDCPYQFFAANCLRLRPPEAIREALRKDDYGKRVHACLEAFYRRVPGLPEPFGQRISPATRDAAIAHLTHIADAVFARDLENNFHHRSWLKRWRAMIPDFIDWEINTGAHWRNEDVELRATRTLHDAPFNLRGRIDRVDRSPDGLRIIDYKTGHTASSDEVRSGEDVQLPFYALLLTEREQPLVQTELVAVDGAQGVRSKVSLNRDELATLSHKNELRLRELIDELRSGQPAIAWGDETTCEYCSMIGVCRKPHWNELGEQQ